jgi:aerobic carbon-monoxide dehydrogenase medium subunit
MTAQGAATETYHVPRTIDEAVALLAAHRHPVVVGGATVVLGRRLAPGPADRALIDIAAVAGLTDVTEGPDAVVLGAAVSYSDLLRTTHPALALLRQLAGGITGGPQIRNQGTVGGSACYANPASDVPTALVALGATLLVAGPAGERAVPAADFFRSAFTTALAADELLRAITVPATASGSSWGYAKLTRGAGSWPLAVAAARLAPDSTVTITLGAATEAPVAVALPGPRGSGPLSDDERETVRRAVRDPAAGWWHDELASASYRARVAPVVALRAVDDAFSKGLPR